jgi:methylthioribose-1-phosphate isomerase
MANGFSIPSGIPIPVEWTEDRSAVQLLDQTLLPSEETYLELTTVDQMVEAIRALRVRGAPAIGIAAAHALALASRRTWESSETGGDPVVLADAFLAARRDLLASRPTAVNLAWALDRLTGVFEATAPKGGGVQVAALMTEADAIAREDREMGIRIGEAGLEVLPERGGGILTHCNAGALATGGVGTALAPAYAAHARGIPVHLYADETRPLLQGARLTAWEAGRVGVPVTVITDSMAGALMKTGKVAMVMVGADRVAANGDTANKIGTYGLAVLAAHHGLPFYVALPRSTFDLNAQTGHAIPIEERSPEEVGSVEDRLVTPVGTQIWNPAFDLTPAHLVTAFITDGGVLRPPYREAIETLLDSSAEETS